MVEDEECRFTSCFERWKDTEMPSTFLNIGSMKNHQALGGRQWWEQEHRHLLGFFSCLCLLIVLFYVSVCSKSRNCTHFESGAHTIQHNGCAWNFDIDLPPLPPTPHPFTPPQKKCLESCPTLKFCKPKKPAAFIYPTDVFVSSHPKYLHNSPTSNGSTLVATVSPTSTHAYLNSPNWKNCG